MDAAKHVLLVTNATTNNEISLIKDAVSQSEKQGLKIKLSLVHVIPNLPTCYFNIPSMGLLAEKYYDEAQNALTTIGQALGICKRDQWLITGRIKTEVLRLASRLNTQFILASSVNIAELHQSSLFKKEQYRTSIKCINNNLVRL